MFKILQIKFKKKKSKKGFTLVELVAVLAIIAILSATLAPKVSNYITDAKKVSVLNEAKSVVTAFESLSHRINESESTYSISSLSAETNSPISADSIKKIPTTYSIEQCRNILNTEEYTIKLSSGGIVESVNKIGEITNPKP